MPLVHTQCNGKDLNMSNNDLVEVWPGQKLNVNTLHGSAVVCLPSLH